MTPTSIVRIVLLSAVPLATALSSPVLAQSGQVSPALGRARQMYDQVEELVNAGKYEEALPIMRATYLLKEHWQNAAMLGLVELKTGHYRDTAEHSAIALRTATPHCLPQTKARIQAQLAEAKTKITTVSLQGVEPGSKILVDGRLAGSTPLADPLFVEPGDHTVEVQNQTATPRVRRLRGTAGAEIVLDFASEPKLPTGAATPTASSSSSSSAGSSPPSGPTAGEPPARLSEPSQSSSSARTWVGIGGGAASLVALGVGVGFWARSRSLISDGDDLHDRYAPALGTAGCSAGGPQCAEISNKYNQAHTATIISTAGIITAGALGVATVAAVLLWPTETRAASTRRMWAAPQVGGAAGLVMGGSF